MDRISTATGFLLALGLLGAAANCSSQSDDTGGAPAATGATGGSGGADGGASSGGAAPDSGGDATAGDATDGGAPSMVPCAQKAANCADDFGTLFTRSNGRADGTLVALVRPQDKQCTWPNSSHVTVQLSINGAVQRLVTSVEGVAVTTVSKPLIGPAYAEGWHEDQNIDYPTDFGVHSGDFKDVSLNEAVEFICSHLEVGDPVSVFAFSEGDRPDSAHQIHRNNHYPDGAIVANPTSASPTYLLFRYADQTF